MLPNFVKENGPITFAWPYAILIAICLKRPSMDGRIVAINLL